LIERKTSPWLPRATANTQLPVRHPHSSPRLIEFAFAVVKR